MTAVSSFRRRIGFTRWIRSERHLSAVLCMVTAAVLPQLSLAQDGPFDRQPLEPIESARAELDRATIYSGDYFVDAEAIPRSELALMGPAPEPAMRADVTDAVPFETEVESSTSAKLRSLTRDGFDRTSGSSETETSQLSSVAGTEPFLAPDPTTVVRDDATSERWTSMTRDAADHIYVAFEDDGIPLYYGTGDVSAASGIRVYRSTDQGASWTPFLTLVSSTTSLHRPDIAYANGYVFVAYERGTGELSIYRRPVSGVLGSLQVNLPMPVTSTGSSTAFNARLVSDAKLTGSNGAAYLYLAFLVVTEIGSGAQRRYEVDLFTTRSMDNGASWIPAHHVASDETVRGGVESRSVALDVGGSPNAPRIYLGYYARTSGSGAFNDENRYALRVRVSTNLGLSYDADVTVDQSEHVYFRHLDLAAFGSNVVLSYNGYVESTNGVIHRYSSDHGSSWDVNLVATSSSLGSVDHDAVGNFYAVYRSNGGVIRLRAGEQAPLVGGNPVVVNTGVTDGVGAAWPLDVSGARTGVGATVSFTAGEGPSNAVPTPDGSEDSAMSGVYSTTLKPIEEPDIAIAPVSVSLYRTPDAASQQPASLASLVDTDYVPDRLIVQLTEAGAGEVGKAGVASALSAIGASVGVRDAAPLFENRATGKRGDAMDRVYLVSFVGPVDVAEAIRTYEADPRVAFAEPDLIWRTTYPGRLAPRRGDSDHVFDGIASSMRRDGPRYQVLGTEPDDPHFPEQWGLYNQGQARPYQDHLPVGRPGIDIGAVDAWTIETGDPSVIVAVLDDGLDTGHPEFSGRILPGYDFVNDDTDPTPLGDDAHGTAAAGIIAAAGNNQVGVSGVAWGVNVLPVKVLELGSGRTSGVAQGIVWAADHGASVISMSLGGTYYSILAEMAVNYAHEAGAVVISAAGNSNADNTVEPHYPAAYSHSLSVGALSPCGTRKRSSRFEDEVNRSYPDPDGVTCDNEFWWGSNFGDLDVLAPGTRIHTTDVTGSAGYHDGDYLPTFNGTSAAAPFVAGVAALLRSHNPNLTPDGVRRILQATAKDVGIAGWDKDSGHGIVNAFAALKLAAFEDSPGSLTIYNAGTQPLNVSSIQTAATWLTTLIPSVAIAPGAFASVELSIDWTDPTFAFSPVQETLLTITSNDPDEGQQSIAVRAISDSSSCVLSWHAGFTIQEPGGARHAVTIGQGHKATNGIDTSCGEAALSDPSGNTDSRFQLPTGDKSYSDIRAAVSDTASWHLEIVSTQRPLTITWDPAVLPDGSFLLQTAGGAPHVVDLRRKIATAMPVGAVANDTLIISDPAVSHIYIERLQNICFRTGLSIGWNLRSVPGHQPSMFPSDIYPETLTEVRTYVGGSGEPGSYAVVNGPLEPGSGHWVHSQRSRSFTLCGVQASPRDVAVEAGWNAIGPFEQELAVSDIATSVPDLISGSVFLYHSGLRMYVPIERLYPGNGYWVKATGSGMLTLDAPGTSPLASEVVPFSNVDPYSPDGSGRVALEGSSSFETKPDRVAGADLEIDESHAADDHVTARIEQVEGDAVTSVSPAVVEFELRFQGSGSILPTKLWFGLDPCAGIGLDPCVDETSLPPTPPEMLEARFVSGSPGPAVLEDGSYRDIRSGGEGATQTEVHHVQIRWRPGDTYIEFEWYEWSTGMTVYLEDANDPDRFSAVLSGYKYDYRNPIRVEDSEVTHLKMTVMYENVGRRSDTSPVAQDDAAATDEGMPVAIPVLANDSDPNGDPLSILSFTQPLSGSVTDSLDAQADSSSAWLVYTPHPAFSGRDAFTYTVTDGQGGVSTASVRVLIYETDDPPPIHAIPLASVVMPGQSVAVDVRIGSAVNPTRDLFGVGFKLWYEPAVLTLLHAELTGLYMGSDPLAIEPVIDHAVGSVALSSSLRAGEPGLEGSGTVARLFFDVSDDPSIEGTTTVFRLTDVLGTDSRGAALAFTPQTSPLLIQGPVSIWPGAIDLNGSVSAADIFPVGGCFGLIGPSRSEPGDISWGPKATEPWGFPVGDPTCTPSATLDPASADANGDGLIDQRDVEAIEAHVGQSISGGKTGAATDTLARITLPPAAVGSTYRLAVGIGNEDAPADNIYGVSARMRLPTGLLTVRGSHPGSLLQSSGAAEGDFLALNHYDPETGIVEAAATLLRGSVPASGRGEGLLVDLEVLEAFDSPIEVILESAQIGSGRGGGSSDVAADQTSLGEAVGSDSKNPRETPRAFALSANYPNPFNPSTTITYTLPAATSVRLVVYDALGREVVVLVDEEVKPAGQYTETFDASDLPSGVYLYRLTAGAGHTAVRRMVLAK